jgi:c-di-GMP-binding flagellar brake protein YcgR
MVDEKRRHPRKEIYQPIHIRFRYSNSWRNEIVEIEGRTKDIGLGGMHLVMHDTELIGEQIPVEAFIIQDILFTFIFPEDEVEVSAFGTLLWYKFVEEYKREFFLSLGIKISKIDEKERNKLDSFIYNAL